MSKEKPTGRPVKFAPPAAREVLSINFVSQAPPADALPKVLVELRGDDLLSSGSAEEALEAYSSMKSTAWRVREKIAACYYVLHRWEECAATLRDAPGRQEKLCNILLLESLEAIYDQTRDWQTKRQMARPAAVLVSLPSPSAREFILAHWCLEDEALRCTTAAKAFDRYPDDGEIRRNYIISRRRVGRPTEDELVELFDLAAKGAASAGATVPDLWLAFSIARSLLRSNIALDYLAKLEQLAGTQVPGIELARGDLLLGVGDTASAHAAYARALTGFSVEPGHDDGLLAALRGQIVVAAKQGDTREAALLTEKLVDNFSRFPDAFFNQSIMLDGGPIKIDVNGDWEWYESNADLWGVRDFLIDALENDDLRGVIRVAFADFCGPTDELTPDQKSGELWCADGETQSPLVARILGWHFLRCGQDYAAGARFARYELARLGPVVEPIDDVHMFDDVDGNESPDIVAFASGMLEELKRSAIGAPTAVAQRGHALFVSLVRGALLEQKEYGLYEQLMQTIATAAPMHETPAAAHFDFGIAAHFLQKPDAAIAAYKQCLALDPDHESAMTNLQMLLPRAEKELLIIEREKSTYPHLADKVTLESISFKEAVYLTTLVRACGGLEQDRILQPFGERECPFAPHRDNLLPIFRLLRAGLVRIAHETPSSAFDVDLSTNEVVGYRFPKVYWEVPDAAMTVVRDIEEAALSGRWPAAWRHNAQELAGDIARGECLAYLDHVATERHLGVPSGEKTKMMIDNVLATHSVGQAFGILWKAAASASDFIQRTRVTPQHAGNTIVGNAQRYVDLARAEGYDLKVYSRPKGLPRSHLSCTLHDMFLRTGSRCHDEPLPTLFAGAWPYGLMAGPVAKKRKS